MYFWAFKNIDISWGTCYDRVAHISLEALMNSKVTYLASRSLAVYEQTLLEQFVVDQQKVKLYQFCRFLLLGLGFVSLAVLALLAPLFLQQIWGRLGL